MNKSLAFCGLALLVLTSSMALKHAMGTSVGTGYLPVPPPTPVAYLPVPPPVPVAYLPVPPPVPAL